ncbi:MAG: hypothetical protein A2032_00385 [Chloroflexi bacterium RBG_19FT_COMBO_49_13]|nr:MAG: hypothetical protein A2032_00385 [Chloroflexi bacterium RBG_19FT_COMBO_49_13]
MLPTLSRIFFIIGVIFVIIAGVFFLVSRFNLPLGKLPGDFQIQGKGFTILFPLATSILLSIVLTVILAIISRYVGRK